MKHLLLLGCTLSLSVALFGCGAQPKQADAPPVFEDSGGEDMQEEEEKELEPAAKMPEEMTAAEKKATCCEQCAKGLAADRTGQPPDMIPCADFTAVLDEMCLGYFRKHSMQASECKGADSPEPSDESADADAPDAGT